VGEPALALVPLCSVDSLLTEGTVVARGYGTLMEDYVVHDASVSGDRLRGQMQGKLTVDWMSGPGATVTLRARASITTDDGATLIVRYEGRSDVSEGRGAAPCYASATFDASDPRYLWLNLVKAVGKGVIDDRRVHWDWYEVK